MPSEPVRGGFPDPSFQALPGIDRADAYVRGFVPRPPLSHLVGYRVTQVGPGTATLTMPASPWLQTFQDYVVFEVLAEAALAMAAMTGAPAGTEVRMASISFSHFRPPTIDSETLLARAHTLKSGRTFGYTEVDIEDAAGRAISQATGTAVFRRAVATPAASQAPELLESPIYPTPDPYLRPLPPGVGTIPDEVWEEFDGPAIGRMSLAGEMPQPPLTALFGLRFLDFDEGHVQLSMPATDWLSRENREVAPGVLALLGTLCGGGTTALKMDRRRLQVGTVADTVSFFRPVPCDGRDVLAHGRITHRPGDFVVSAVEITDADGSLVAVGHRISVFLEPRATHSVRRHRELLTVMFTDVVDSTRKAKEFGDERWSALLDEHHRLARRQLEIHGGREVKTTGDGFLATFDSPGRAIQSARAIRDAVRRLGLDIRVGLHTGECERSGGDVAGIAVHIASRVQTLAAPGEILISRTVRDLVIGSGLHFEDRGLHQLKGVEGDWPIYAVMG